MQIVSSYVTQYNVHVVGEVVYGSALHVQLKEFGTDIQVNNTCISSKCSPSVSSCERIKRSLFKTEDEIAEAESQTRTKSAWQEWYKHTFGRVTASDIHRVGYTHRVGTSPSKIIKEVLYSNNNYIVSVTGHES